MAQGRHERRAGGEASFVTQEAAATRQFRSHVGHISRQSGIFFAGTIFTAAFSYVFKVYLARVLGAEDLGIYALGITLVGFVSIFNSLGLAQSAVRFVAAYSASGKLVELHSLLWRGGGILLLANVGFAGLLLLFGRFVAVHVYHSPELVRYLPWLALIMILGVFSNFYGKVLAGYRDLTHRTIIVNFVGSPLMMATALALILAGMRLRGYLLGQVLAATVVCVLLFIAVRRLTPEPARITAQRGTALRREVWAFSAAMMGISLMEFLMAQVDRITLGYYAGARAVGIYSVAAGLVVYVSLVLNSVNQVFSPMISDLHTRGESILLSRLFQSLTKWVLGLTIPLAAVIILFSRTLMRIFGHDFEEGWPILIIGTIGQLVNCGVGSVGFLLLMSGNERRLIKIQIVMATIMVVLSLALVPLWGVLGAAIAAAITNAGTNLWNLIEVRSALGFSPYNRSYLRLLLPTVAVIMVVVLLKKHAEVFRHDWLTVGTTTVAAYAVFTAIIFAFGLDADDRLIANEIWSRMRGKPVGTVAGAAS
jgi:O-antigen/teichoic acid export membrane protein